MLNQYYKNVLLVLNLSLNKYLDYHSNTDLKSTNRPFSKQKYMVLAIPYKKRYCTMSCKCHQTEDRLIDKKNCILVTA